MSREADSSKKTPVWRMIAVAGAVLVTIAIVFLKPGGDSVTEPSSVSSPRTESTTHKSMSEPVVSSPPPSRPEVDTERRVDEVELSAPAPTGTEAEPPPTRQAERKLPLMLDIGSTTCIPCKRMAPILEELKEEYRGVVEIKFLDIYRERTAAREYGIMAIPTQIFYDEKGRESHRHVGYLGKEEILKVFRNMGVEL